MPDKEPTDIIASSEIIDSVDFKPMVAAVINNANIPGAFTREMIRVTVRSYLENKKGVTEQTPGVKESIESTTTAYIESLLQAGTITRIDDYYVFVESEAYDHLKAVAAKNLQLLTDS